MGPAIDRWGFFRILVPCFAVAAISILLIGVSERSLWVLFLVVVISGFCIVGAQPGINAMAGVYYPTELRATGIGWGLGVGRIGSIVGPVIGGVFISYNWSLQQLFTAAMVPAAISVIVLLAIRLTWRR